MPARLSLSLASARSTPRAWLLFLLLSSCTTRPVLFHVNEDGETTTTSDGADTASTTGGAPVGEGDDGTTAPAELCGNGVLDPGESCDDGNILEDDGCLANCVAAGPLPPVWSHESQWATCLAVLDGELVGHDAAALVIGGLEHSKAGRLDLAPLAPGGLSPWSLSGPPEWFSALAIAADGDIIAAASDASGPGSHLWLGRFTPTGEPIWSHDAPGVPGVPQHVQVAPNGDIIVLVDDLPGPSQVVAIDAAGAFRWARVAQEAPNSEIAYTGLALTDQGRIYVVGTRRDDEFQAFEHLVMSALSPQGEVVWQRELESPVFADGPQVVVASDGGLLVAMGQRLGADPDEEMIAALAGFDAAGELQWWREDATISHDYVSAGAAVPLPSGSVFVAWRLSGDAIVYQLARYDAAGAQVYQLSPAGNVNDLDLGPDGLVYSLEYSTNDDDTPSYDWVVPYLP